MARAFPSLRRFAASRQPYASQHVAYHTGSYLEAPDVEATWFIDPPYRGLISGYRFDSTGLDYERLAGWCRSRRGLVIVAESEGADWLPFRSLAAVQVPRNGSRREVVWSNDWDQVLAAQGRRGIR